MHSAPSFGFYSPCEIIKWLVLLGGVFVGGAIGLQYAMRPTDVDALEADKWLRFNGQFLMYGALSVACATVVYVLFSLTIFAVHWTCHYVFCCRACCGRRQQHRGPEKRHAGAYSGSLTPGGGHHHRAVDDAPMVHYYAAVPPHAAGGAATGGMFSRAPPVMVNRYDPPSIV